MADDSAVILEIESDDASDFARRITRRLQGSVERVTGYPMREDVAFTLDEARMTFDCEEATVACMQSAAANFQTPLLIWGTVTGGAPTRILLYRIDSGDDAGHHTLDATVLDLREADDELDTIVMSFLERRSYQAPVELSVTSQPPGAEVFLDARAIGQTPLKIRTSSGDHNIAIEMDGYERVRQPILLRDHRSELHFRLDRVPQEIGPMSATPVDDVEDSTLGWPFWTAVSSGVVAVAGVAGGIYYGLETIRINDELQETGTTYSASATRLQQAIVSGLGTPAQVEQNRVALEQLNRAFEPQQAQLTREYEDAQFMANVSWIVTVVALTTSGAAWYLHESIPKVSVAPNQVSLSVSF